MTLPESSTNNCQHQTNTFYICEFLGQQIKTHPIFAFLWALFSQKPFNDYFFAAAGSATMFSGLRDYSIIFQAFAIYLAKK